MVLSEDEWIYVAPDYHLALHVPDENARIPVPSQFTSRSEYTAVVKMILDIWKLKLNALSLIILNLGLKWQNPYFSLIFLLFIVWEE